MYSTGKRVGWPPASRIRHSGTLGLETFNDMLAYLWIAVGGGLGTALRYWCSGVFARWLGQGFPWGTLFINVVGCAFIGVFATLTEPDGRVFLPSAVRQFVMIGICGGFTTFSTFGLETLNLARDGQPGRAGLNALSSPALCLIGVWLGHVCGVYLNRLKGGAL